MALSLLTWLYGMSVAYLGPLLSELWNCPKFTLSHESPLIRIASRRALVIPAQAGIQKRLPLESILDSRVRENDGLDATAA